MPLDSTGKVVNIGDTVRFRGKNFTIKRFLNNSNGRFNTSQIEFEEPQHTTEIADEISIDKV